MLIVSRGYYSLTYLFSYYLSVGTKALPCTDSVSGKQGGQVLGLGLEGCGLDSKSGCVATFLGLGTLLAALITRSSATADKQRVSCPHGGGARPSAPSGCIYAYGRIPNPQQTYVKRAVH